MSKHQQIIISQIYEYLLKNNPSRLKRLASIYSSQSGISEDYIDGLDAIINFIVFQKYNVEQILYNL